MTFAKLKQDYLAIASALTFFVLSLKFDLSSKLDIGKLMDKSVDLASISFGFLLAVLALLLQANNPALARIKDSGQFSSLINLNKKAVLASGLLLIIALTHIGLDLSSLKDYLFEISAIKLINSVCLSLLVYQLIIVYLFLDIFYFIAKQEY